MAGDWIKMRIDLQTHPKIVRILSATKADKFRVIGGLHAVWSIFDAHSEDGRLHGYTPETLDHIIGWEGFSSAMIAVGWLISDCEALELPEFSEHNGQSAKRRGEDQKRKRDSRKCPQSVRNLSEENRTREEKRRDIENPSDSLARTVSKKRSAPASSAKLDYETGALTGISQKLLSTWEEAYPAIDVREEIRKAKAWLLANPANRKKNLERFLNSWLSKSQDSARKVPNENSRPDYIDNSAAGRVRAAVARSRAEREAAEQAGNRNLMADDEFDVRASVVEFIRR